MTLTELQNEVYTITNRPDMVSQTQSAVRNATLSLHQSDYYFKDLVETGLSLLTEDYIQEWEYLNPTPLFRALKYIRLTDSAGAENGRIMEIIPPELAVDNYAINKPNVAYVAGNIIRVRAAVPFQYLIMGYYANPDITVEGFSSWIARDHPFAIVAKASARIFKQTGKDSEYAVWTGEANDELARLKSSNIVAGGY